MDWLSFSSGCTARVGASDELHVLHPNRSRILSDPVERDAVPSGALTSGVFFYSYSFRHRLPIAAV
jgi:hypothetical protein